MSPSAALHQCTGSLVGRTMAKDSRFVLNGRGSRSGKGKLCVIGRVGRSNDAFIRCLASICRSYFEICQELMKGRELVNNGASRGLLTS